MYVLPSGSADMHFVNLPYITCTHSFMVTGTSFQPSPFSGGYGRGRGT